MKGIGFYVDTDGTTDLKTPYLNDIFIPYIKVSNGLVKIQFAIEVSPTKTLPTIVTLSDVNDGEFFSDQEGNISLGTKVSYTSSGKKVLYFKPNQSGTIIFRYPEDITALGEYSAGDWNPANEWIGKGAIDIQNFDIAQVSCCSKLEVFFPGYNNSQIGNIQKLKGLNKLRVISLKAKSILTGSTSSLKEMPLSVLRIDGIDELDVNHIPNSILFCQCMCNKLVNSGDTLSPAYTNIAILDIFSTTKMNTQQSDRYIISLSESLQNSIQSRVLKFSGQKTSLSDSAIIKLSQKNYTVQLD